MLVQKTTLTFKALSLHIHFYFLSNGHVHVHDIFIQRQCSMKLILCSKIFKYYCLIYFSTNIHVMSMLYQAQGVRLQARDLPRTAHNILRARKGFQKSFFLFLFLYHSTARTDSGKHLPTFFPGPL